MCAQHQARQPLNVETVTLVPPVRSRRGAELCFSMIVIRPFANVSVYVLWREEGRAFEEYSVD